MLEWLKRHAWKACKLQKGFGGSNPPLSARLLRTTESELAQVRLRVKGLQGCPWQTMGITEKSPSQKNRGRLWVFEVGERSEVGALESSRNVNEVNHFREA